MKICFLLGAGEPPYSSAKSLAHAFRELGNDVVTCGPPYAGRADADVLLPRREHVEYYSPEEVLSRLPWTAELLVNCEPAAFLRGPRPDRLRVVFCATDAHRAAELYTRVLLEKSYSHFVNFQIYHSPLFQHLPVKMLSMPVGFDARRFPKQEHTPSPVCDISFVGFTAIANLEYTECDEIGPYATHPPRNLPTDIRRYATCGLPSLDYAPRAEMLLHLMAEYKVRIYREVWDDKLQAAIQKGAVGFHRSLLQDVALRVYEVCAAQRLLLTDRVPHFDSLFRDGFHCQLYDSFFFAGYSNFSLEVALVMNHVRKYLNNDTLREAVAERGHDLVWASGQWKHRARAMLEFILNS